MVIHRSEHIDLRLELHQLGEKKKQAGPQSKLAKAGSLIVGKREGGGGCGGGGVLNHS